MSSLTTTPNLADADGFYAELIGTHEGLSDAASAALNARLVLLLANHIGDPDVLREALLAARAAGSDIGERSETPAPP